MRQNHKYWVDQWKKFCNLNIVDPPPKPKANPADSLLPKNNFLLALMNMSRKAKEAEEQKENEERGHDTPQPHTSGQTSPPTRGSNDKNKFNFQTNTLSCSMTNQP
jgi:hypothetical protein